MYKCTLHSGLPLRLSLGCVAGVNSFSLYSNASLCSLFTVCRFCKPFCWRLSSCARPAQVDQGGRVRTTRPLSGSVARRQETLLETMFYFPRLPAPLLAALARARDASSSVTESQPRLIGATAAANQLLADRKPKIIFSRESVCGSRPRPRPVVRAAPLPPYGPTPSKCRAWTRTPGGVVLSRTVALSLPERPLGRGARERALGGWNGTVCCRLPAALK